MFGLLLAQYRNAKQLSVRELARAVGVSDSFITRLEKGERTPPSLATVYKLEKVLDVPSERLVFPALVERWSEDLWAIIESQLLQDNAYKTVVLHVLKEHLETLVASGELTPDAASQCLGGIRSGSLQELPLKVRWPIIMMLLAELNLDFVDEQIHAARLTPDTLLDKS